MNLNALYTPELREEIRKARSYECLADLGVVVLDRIRHQKQANGVRHQPTIEICGPITTGGLGSFEKNIKLFGFAIEEAARRGCWVFDPRPFQVGMLNLGKKNGHTAHNAHRHYDVSILEIFYARVFESGYIGQAWFLPRWQESRGAVWERTKVRECNIPVRPYPRKWLEEIK